MINYEVSGMNGVDKKEILLNSYRLKVFFEDIYSANNPFFS